MRTSLLAILATFGVAATVQAQEPQPYLLDGFVVTASPFPVALSALGNHVSVLEGDDLRARGVSHVVDALRGVAGLAVAQNGPVGSVTSVFFRGGESDYVLVLVDGVQVNQPGGAYDFSGLTTEAIERIEIVRGPSSALHGSDAIAGVIHIITRDGHGETRAVLDVGAGNYGTRSAALSVSGGGERASYALSAARYRTEGILEFNNESRNTVFNGKADVRLGAGGRLTLTARLGERAYHFPTDFAGSVVDRNQFTFADESTLSASWTRPLGGSADLRVLLSAYSVEGGTEDAADGPADTLGFYAFQSLDAYRRTALDVRGGWRLTPRTRWTLGAELERQVVRSFNASESEFGPSGGQDSNERGNRAVYSHLATAVGRLQANLGIRQEDNERFGGFTSLQASASLPLSERVRVRAAWGRGVKEPTFLETFASGFVRGNPELAPERSSSWEVGAEQTLLDERLRLQGTLFGQSFRDLIQYTATPPAAGAPNYFNVAKADADGFEVGAEARLRGVSLSADWTRLDTKVIDAGFDEGPGATFVRGAPLLRRPRDQVRASLGGRVGRLGAQLSIRRVGERADRNFTVFPAESVSLAAYATLDAAFDWVVKPGGEREVALVLRTGNLMNTAYEEVFGFAAPGRTLEVGGTLRWSGGR
ncbi:MAG: TonB-dependent receptor [Gemmatimonadota bacterium]